jgi:hypothetical protein
VGGCTPVVHRRYNWHMRIIALLLGLVAVMCLIVAIAGMATGKPGDRVGGWLRVIAIVCFAACVIVNTIAHH